MIQRLEETTSIPVGPIIIAKTVSNATLEFLCYGAERKIGFILRCKLATHVKIATCQFVPNFLGYVTAQYYLD